MTYVHQMKRNNSLKWLSILIGGILALLINLVVLGCLIGNDPCYYHTNETTFWIDLFYTTNSGNNHHPAPNIRYLLMSLLSLIVGGALGWTVYRRFLSD